MASAGIVARSQLKKYADFGAWDDGDIMLSIPSDSPLYGCAQYDRVAALDKSEAFSINFIAGVNDTQLRFPVVSIDRVSWFADGDLHIGETPSVVDGEIVWGTETPPTGVTYALSGRRTPDYFIYLDLPIDRPEHHGAPLPRRVALRRFDLFGR